MTSPAPPSSRLSLDELGDLALGRGPGRLSPWRLYFRLGGRISRTTFWLHGVLALLTLAALINALLDIAGLANDTDRKLVNVALMWPYIALSGKRLHDFNRSSWWMLVNFVPGVGSIVMLLVNGLTPGTHGPNDFGADPAPTRLPPRPLNTAR